MALTRLADFQELTGKDKLSVVEEAFIEACRRGELYMAGDGTRPDTATKDNTIRASLLRYLILGGCDTCRTATQGVQLMGAYVTGQLDLDFGRAVGQTFLVDCRFAQPIQALQTRFEALTLSGSACPGLMAQGAEVTGNLFLRNKFHTSGGVSLAGAKIGGQLDCERGRFENANGDALNAEGVEVTGNLFLRTGFHATGRASLASAKVGGQLACDGGHFENAGGYALNVERLQVIAAFIWRDVTVSAGCVNLASASVGDLADDLKSWPVGPGRLILDGFTYGRISAAFTDAPRRLDWLKRGTVWKGEFLPQPYRQLARVLHEMGHDRAARQVLMECDRLLAADQRAKDKERAAQLWASDDQTVRGDIGWHWLRSRLARLWNWLIRFVAGYGYAPERTFYWAMGILTAGTLFFFVAWRQGVIVPNSAVILTSASWASAMLENPGAPAHAWVTLPAGQHYETFYSLPYTFDILVPFVDIGQETAWSQTTGSWFGWTARVVAMGIEVAGWLISALGAAAITGLIRRDGD